MAPLIIPIDGAISAFLAIYYYCNMETISCLLFENSSEKYWLEWWSCEKSGSSLLIGVTLLIGVSVDCSKLSKRHNILGNTIWNCRNIKNLLFLLLIVTRKLRRSISGVTLQFEFQHFSCYNFATAVSSTYFSSTTRKNRCYRPYFNITLPALSL